MTTSEPGSTGQSPGTQTNDPETLQHHVAQTRQELGDTVEALAIKADARRQAVQQAGRALRERRGPIAAAAAVLATGWLLRLVRKRRRQNGR